MKTIGLIGGMSWESTITYYEILNKEIAKALGGFHSAKIMMYNVDFAELEANSSIVLLKIPLLSIFNALSNSFRVRPLAFCANADTICVCSSDCLNKAAYKL